MKRKAYVACNINCNVETEGLLKVTGSHVHSNVHCKSGDISKMCACLRRFTTNHYGLSHSTISEDLE